MMEKVGWAIFLGLLATVLFFGLVASFLDFADFTTKGACQRTLNERARDEPKEAKFYGLGVGLCVYR